MDEEQNNSALPHQPDLRVSGNGTGQGNGDQNVTEKDGPSGALTPPEQRQRSKSTSVSLTARQGSKVSTTGFLVNPRSRSATVDNPMVITVPYGIGKVLMDDKVNESDKEEGPVGSSPSSPVLSEPKSPSSRPKSSKEAQAKRLIYNLSKASLTSDPNAGPLIPETVAEGFEESLGAELLNEMTDSQLLKIALERSKYDARQARDSKLNEDVLFLKSLMDSMEPSHPTIMTTINGREILATAVDDDKLETGGIPGDTQKILGTSAYAESLLSVASEEDLVAVASPEMQVEYDDMLASGNNQSNGLDNLSAAELERLQRLKEEHPSRLIQLYPARNAKDATTQTRDKPTRKGKGLVLPSEQLNPIDYISDGADTKEKLLHSTLGRIASEGKSVDSHASSKMASKTSKKISEDPASDQTIKERTKGRKIVANIEAMKRRSKMSWYHRWLYDFKKFTTKSYKETRNRIGIWRTELRFIESRYGTGVVTYFSLFRWVYVLDIFLAIIWYIFVILFGILEMSSNDNKGWKEFMQINNGTGVLATSDLVQQLFSGKENIQRTFFFYGNYKSKVKFGSDGPPYNMDTAYYAVIIFFYIISFIAILWRMRQLFVSRKEFYDQVSIDKVSPFGTTCFSGWDFSIRDNEAKVNRNFAISTLIKTLISSDEVKEKKKQVSSAQATENIIRRIITNFIVLMLLLLSSLVIWFAILVENGSYPGFEFVQGNAFISPSAFVISFLTFILPFVFNKLAKFERYANPATELSVNLARAFITKVASIYIIIIQFYIVPDQNSPSRFVISLNKRDCWESQIGQLFYQLIWTNLFLTVLGTVGYGLYALLISGKAKYDYGIAENILEVIYRQGLVWVGTIYSPMLIVVYILSGWIIFYVKMIVIRTCGLPPKRIYNSYQQNIYFLFFLLVMLGLMALPVFYGLTVLEPSCGPFGPTEQSPPLLSAYEIIPRGINNLQSRSLRNVLNFIGSLSFTIPAIVVLSIWIYYLLAIGERRRKGLKQLVYEVNTERADKRFLLRYYKVKM